MELRGSALESLVTPSMFENAGLFGGVFAGRRVLVTGHTGFKGSWLCCWLQALGAEVTGYALEPPTQPNLFDKLGLAQSIAHIHGDVRDGDSLRDAFKDHQPEIIFHLAAQSLVRRAYSEPLLTYETNVMGTVNVLEAVRRSPGARVVINVTSDKCYENREWDYAYRENDPMGGFDPYSSSKGCAELVAAAYRNSFLRGEGVSLASVRAGNVVGGGDWAQDRIVPDCVRALSGNEAIQVRNPGATRPWQHVLEPLAGYLWLAGRLWAGEQDLDDAWNFGPDPRSNIRVQAVVETVIREWGSGAWQGPPAGSVQPHEAGFLTLDCMKAGNRLRWYPVYDIDETLRVTTAWYKAFYQQTDMMSVTLKDIEDYVEAAVRKRLAWTASSE